MYLLKILIILRLYYDKNVYIILNTMFNIILLFYYCNALSFKCDYQSINGPVSTHVLYKEDNLNVVKWLEKYEYCRAKGDTTVYKDAGKDKCEYSRDICFYYDNECIFNETRENDLLEECQDLLNNNILEDGLDLGRQNEPIEIVSETELEPTKTELEPTETELEPTETELEPTETEETEECQDLISTSSIDDKVVETKTIEENILYSSTKDNKNSLIFLSFLLSFLF